MLTLLKIQNLALIDLLVWEPGRNLTCVTGETGAGKSVIINALKLVLGERADKNIIRSGEENCIVEAVFDLESPDAVNKLLEEAGLPPCEDSQLILKRVLSRASNRQFINNGASTLSVMKDLGMHLVDMHSPGDQMALLSTERQSAMLDMHGGASTLQNTYAVAWKEWQSNVRAHQDLLLSEKASEAEIELLTHQVREIEEAELQPGEEMDLEERWGRVRNASRLSEGVSKALQLISGEGQPSLFPILNDLQRCTGELERLDPSLMEKLAPLNLISTELREIEAQLQDYFNELDSDPATAQILEDRINLLESLKRKYGPSLDHVTEHYDRSKTRLDSIENRTELLIEWERKISRSRELLDKAGQALTRARQKAAPVLSRDIIRQLHDLGFSHAEFRVDLIPLSEPQSTGMERVEFLISPNAGEPLKPLRHIASSGEMARIMLAVKTVLAGQDSTPLLVFDEIDANVGGEIARAVGEKMAALGERHQVISITHFPQVAAASRHHYLVEKNFDGERTRSIIREIKNADRVNEIVRMLGGGGDSARAHAEALLQR